MCQQYIGIAQCAPSNPNTGPLTFVCGQLHQYAEYRELCTETKGGCVCFFGTCGHIENVVRAQPFDFMRLPKMRCLPCTGREEQIGERRHGRDFLETQLLTREPVADDGMVAHAKMLRQCWGGANVCPYHDLSQNGSSKATSKASSVNGADKGDIVEGVDLKNNSATGSIDGGDPKQPISIKSGDDKQSAAKDTQEIINSNGTVESNSSSRAATPTAPIKQESISSKGSRNKLDQIPAYSREGSYSSNKNTESSPQVKPMLGIETSRWAPGGAGRLETTSEPEKERQQTTRRVPRRDLYNFVPQTGKSAFSDMAKNMKAFMAGM